MVCINRTFREVRRKECCHKAGSSFPILKDIPNKDIELLRKGGLCLPFKETDKPQDPLCKSAS